MPAHYYNIFSAFHWHHGSGLASTSDTATHLIILPDLQHQLRSTNDAKKAFLHQGVDIISFQNAGRVLIEWPVILGIDNLLAG
jgi:hypothetical protein